MTTLTPQDIRVLEQTRQRLYQLTDSLNSLNRDVHTMQPLPPWSSLKSRFSILSQNLASLSTHLTTHAPLLNALSVFPLPSFPGTSQENILVQLLRKKLEPGVEEWVDEGVKFGKEAAEEEEGMDWRELWDWAPAKANEEARGYEWLTAERAPEEDEDGMDVEDEDEEEEGEGVQDAEGADEGKGTMKMEGMLKFMSTGMEPKRG